MCDHEPVLCEKLKCCFQPGSGWQQRFKPSVTADPCHITFVRVWVMGTGGQVLRESLSISCCLVNLGQPNSLAGRLVINRQLYYSFGLLSPRSSSPSWHPPNWPVCPIAFETMNLFGPKLLKLNLLFFPQVFETVNLFCPWLLKRCTFLPQSD